MGMRVCRRRVDMVRPGRGGVVAGDQPLKGAVQIVAKGNEVQLHPSLADQHRV